MFSEFDVRLLVSSPAYLHFLLQRNDLHAATDDQQAHACQLPSSARKQMEQRNQLWLAPRLPLLLYPNATVS